MEVHGKLVDIHKREIYSAVITIEDGRIAAIEPNSHRGKGFILPGFVDAHIHIESSMLPPTEFARISVRHGTVATVSDPHEIANVLGISGVEYMLEDASKSPFKFNFGAPSCVPATTFETAGATLGPKEVRELLEKPEIKYLSEVMNFPGVIAGDPDMLEKIAIAKELGKRIDGHAPGVFGEDLKKYVAAGIETDHECTTLSEAREKHALGMKILLREGSAAKNFNALFPLMQEDPAMCMLCSDDLHPDNLILGHINLLVRRAIEKGMDLMDVLSVASKNPVEHYGLDVGLLRVGDPADFIIVEDLDVFRVLENYIDGECVFQETSLLPRIKTRPINKFDTHKKTPADFKVPAKEGDLHVIEAIDGQLITKHLTLPPKIENNEIVSDTSRDILKIAVVNRYNDAKPAVGFVKNFGLKKGAIASSVAHDSHNIVAVGVTDEDLCNVVNSVIDAKGGVATSHSVLPLPIAGLMSDLDGEEVAVLYGNLDEAAKDLGSELKAPFMTLAFMALLVIPALKMSDLGLFDCKSFSLIDF
ncbi:MAG: adenine deaminase [Simkaniaceae bacterium]|nr:adenine deaminase [Candidatus Sacchlamyda saccharinae]